MERKFTLSNRKYIGKHSKKTVSLKSYVVIDETKNKKMPDSLDEFWVYPMGVKNLPI